MSNSKYWNIRPVFLSLLVFFLLVLFYSPVFAPDFAYQNDYEAFVPHYYGFPEGPGLAYLGRPLQAILVNIQFRFLGDMVSFQLMRIFVVLIMAFEAILFFKYLQKNTNINIYSAALLSLLVFTLPSMAINSFYMVQSGQGVAPLLFIFLACHLMQIRKYSNVNQNLIFIATFVLIFLSLLIYPTTSFFFLTLTFIKFIFGTKESSQAKLSDIFTEVTIFFSACIAYFLFIKYIFKPLMYGDVIETPNPYSFSLTFDIASKLPKIIDLYAFDLSAWFPILEYYFLVPLGLGFVLIITWATLRTPFLAHLQNSTKIIVGVSLSALIPIILIAPLFVNQGEYNFAYRVCFATMAGTIPVAVVFLIDRAKQLKRGIIVCISVLLVFSPYIFLAEKTSYDRVKFEVNHLRLEYQHVYKWFVAEYADYNYSQQTGIKIIQIPPFTALPDPSQLLSRDYGYTSVDSTTDGMVRSVIQDIDAYKRHLLPNSSMDGFHISYEPNGPHYKANINEGIIFSRIGYPSFISNYTGISVREPWGRWTDSNDAVIEFAQSLPRQFILTIEAGTSDSFVGKPVKIAIGDAQLDAIFNSQEPTETTFQVVTNGQAKSITFHFPTLATASSSDNRHLGLALIKLKIAPNDFTSAQNSLIRLIPPHAVSTKFPVDLMHEITKGVDVDGLSGLESNTKENWRWATGPSTRLKFYVDPSSRDAGRRLLLKFAFKNGAFIPNQAVTLRLNGKDIYRFSSQEISSRPEVFAEVALAAQKGINILEFDYQDWNHGKKDYAPDPRPLAVVFTSLSLDVYPTK